jgi:hypothetical protein
MNAQDKEVLTRAIKRDGPKLARLMLLEQGLDDLAAEVPALAKELGLDGAAATPAPQP